MPHFSAAQALMNSFSFSEADVDSDVEGLTRRIEQQNLIIQTMLVLLLEKGAFTEDEFRAWVKKMDELDGVRDGKLSEDKTMIPCPACGKSISKKAAKCQYCGASIEPDLIPPRP